MQASRLAPPPHIFPRGVSMTENSMNAPSLFAAAAIHCGTWNFSGVVCGYYSMQSRGKENELEKGGFFLAGSSCDSEDTRDFAWQRQAMDAVVKEAEAKQGTGQRRDDNDAAANPEPIVVKGQEKAQQETNENPNLPH
eukprot:scaffold20692_cov147-Skeletonema_marinoi.AAC.25